MKDAFRRVVNALSSKSREQPKQLIESQKRNEKYGTRCLGWRKSKSRILRNLISILEIVLNQHNHLLCLDSFVFSMLGKHSAFQSLGGLKPTLNRKYNKDK